MSKRIAAAHAQSPHPDQTLRSSSRGTRSGLDSMAGLGKCKEGAMAGLGKCKEGALGARSMRSLKRALMTEEASASEQSEILRLKREARALRKRTPEEEALLQRVMRKMNRTAADEEPQPAAGNKRRKTVIKETPVPREAIEYMISNPYNPLRGYCEEKLAFYSEDLRQTYFKQKAIAANMLEQERALIKQFRKKGYAVDYTEVEVTDDEEEDN